MFGRKKMKEKICKLCGHKENEHDEKGCHKIVREIPMNKDVTVIEVCECKVSINETKEKDDNHTRHMHKMWVKSVLYQDG
jgi:hypothetical protein